MKKNGLSLTAVAVSFVALFVSYFHLKETQDFNETTFQPMLDIRGHFNQTKSYDGLYLVNLGGGLARIQRHEIQFDDKLIEESRDDFLSKLPDRLDWPGGIQISFARFGPELTLAPGEEILLFGYSADSRLSLQNIHDLNNRVKWFFKYCSIYHPDECKVLKY